MASFMEVDDLYYRIVFLLGPKEVIRSRLLNKRCDKLIRGSNVYLDLLMVKHLPLKYKFDSPDIIKQYYQYRLINLLQQYYYYHEDGVYSAAENGHIDILSWMKSCDWEFTHIPSAIDLAATAGHVCVLDWFLHSDLEFSHVYNIDKAAERGHVCVLEWFSSTCEIDTQDAKLITSKSDLKFNYSKYAIIRAAAQTGTCCCIRLVVRFSLKNRLRCYKY